MAQYQALPQPQGNPQSMSKARGSSKHGDGFDASNPFANGVHLDAACESEQFSQAQQDFVSSMNISSRRPSMHWKDSTRHIDTPHGLPTPQFHPADAPFTQADYAKYHSNLGTRCVHGAGLNDSMMDPIVACAASSCQADRLELVTPPPSDGSGPRSPPWETMYHPQYPLEVPGLTRARNEYYESTIRSSSPVERIDGVRKKNAKFEIPDEHNLENLDNLIACAPDESKRKEYKMHKRLLRNREAALHSRQKKKAYTEELELENARLKGIINDLQGQKEASKMRNKASEHQKGVSHQKYAQMDQRARKLLREREVQGKEIVRLRHEISQLKEPMHSAHVSPWSSLPSSAVYANFGPDAIAGPIDMQEWTGDLNFTDDFCLDPHKLQHNSETISNEHESCGMA
ncbi:MAG: hypothetical protein M1828_002587 [Chrysothrix sp. TS-e1954]|nr:MAG: hypothetical protein M1828_002587 [Chrysothrix sp. TS-e1954]